MCAHGTSSDLFCSELTPHASHSLAIFTAYSWLGCQLLALYMTAAPATHSLICTCFRAYTTFIPFHLLRLVQTHRHPLLTIISDPLSFPFCLRCVAGSFLPD
ncbi:hypothetical protein PAXRUDRAFT_279859 [Paxillus rubicundulus Ve08.2h10]|uniref:Unplaced genomic scaffold scaffold_146, whole genome shotgun sequence n=1 Tax=Paxillus rubicundulus Ve08.2h10 TaxID=930991 RepID=A0A0D0DG32_9AGAM|nr:hypothetical protein PAXRUDRAFT_279859 [Paxillus rubicundulus Ve08.2h10]